MDALIASSVKPRFTKADLAGLSTAELHSLQVSQQFLAPSAGAQKWLNSHPQFTAGCFTDSEKRLLAEMGLSVSSGNVPVIGNFEQTSWVNSATVTYSKDGVSINRNDGSSVQYNPGPVPIEKPRMGAARLSIFYCSLFHLKGGSLESVIPYLELKKRFNVNGGVIDVTDLFSVRSVFYATLICYPAFATAVRELKTVQGNVFLDMVVNAFQSSSWENYFSLHNVVCTRFLKAVNSVTTDDQKVRIVSRKTRKDKQGKLHPMVPADSVIHITGDWARGKMGPDALKALLNFRDRVGHWPFFLNGPVHTTHNFPGVSETLKGAYASYAAAGTLRGSPYAGMGTFLQSAGFSSMSSAHHNNMCLLVGMALHALRMTNSNVCMYLTVGQMAVVDASMQAQSKDYYGRLSYVVEGGDVTSVNNQYMHKVVTTASADDHIIRLFQATPPSVSTDIDPSARCYEHANKVLSPLAAARGFTIQAAVCSSSFWAPRFKTVQEPDVEEASSEDDMDLLGDSNVLEVESKDLPQEEKIITKAPGQPLYVFKYKPPFDMRGIVSTLPSVSLNLEGDRLERYDSPRDWWKAITIANATANLYFLKPVTFFNSLSNILKPEFKALGIWRDDEHGWEMSAVDHKDTIFGDDEVVGDETLPLEPDSEEVLEILRERVPKPQPPPHPPARVFPEAGVLPQIVSVGRGRGAHPPQKVGGLGRGGAAKQWAEKIFPNSASVIIKAHAVTNEESVTGSEGGGVVKRDRSPPREDRKPEIKKPVVAQVSSHLSLDDIPLGDPDGEFDEDKADTNDASWQ